MVKASSDVEGSMVMMLSVKVMGWRWVGSRCDDEVKVGVVMDVGFGNGNGEGGAVFGYESWWDARWWHQKWELDLGA
ncbi:hypothetical protein V6N12_009768 [Hibiscus sabdariffa]|uniref:Uncharacterized protein n=1 Tax=Hibiscus sabdariffa TaxID=183260 RepID=A0ABR2EBN3_9ROSI